MGDKDKMDDRINRLNEIAKAAIAAAEEQMRIFNELADIKIPYYYNKPEYTTSMTCCCSLAGTQACFYCHARYQPYYSPQPPIMPMIPFQQPVSTPEIDYEKLAEMVAEKLKKRQERPGHENH